MSKHCCKDMFSSKSSPIWLQFCSGSCKNPTHKWTVIIILIIFSIFSDSHLLKHSVTVAAGAGPNIRSAQKEGEKQQNKTKNPKIWVYLVSLSRSPETEKCPGFSCREELLGLRRVWCFLLWNSENLGVAGSIFIARWAWGGRGGGRGGEVHSR